MTRSEATVSSHISASSLVFARRRTRGLVAEQDVVRRQQQFHHIGRVQGRAESLSATVTSSRRVMMDEGNSTVRYKTNVFQQPG